MPIPETTGTGAVSSVASQNGSAKHAGTRTSQSSGKKRSRSTMGTTQDTLTTQIAETAESAILIPVGAALITRERVVDAITPWTSRTSAERQLRKYEGQLRREVRRFERRGSVARKSTVRELQQQRKRALRELRRSRKRVERLVRGGSVGDLVEQNRRRLETGLTRFQRTLRRQTPRTKEQPQRAS